MDYPLRLADQLRVHLKALRKQRGLTQAQLGQRLGIGQVRVAEIEARPGLVSADQLIKLLAALGVTLVVRDRAASDPTAPTATPGAAPAGKPKPRRAAKLKPVARTPSSGMKPAKPAKTQPFIIPPKKGSW